jgi:hypothetical protein
MPFRGAEITEDELRDIDRVPHRMHAPTQYISVHLHRKPPMGQPVYAVAESW